MAYCHECLLELRLYCTYMTDWFSGGNKHATLSTGREFDSSTVETFVCMNMFVYVNLGVFYYVEYVLTKKYMVKFNGWLVQASA